MTYLHLLVKGVRPIWALLLATLTLRVHVNQLNDQAVRTLKAIRESLGIRSGAAFARQMAALADGSPDPSTYNRWERGEQLVPAWALVTAARLAQQPLDLVLAHVVGSPATLEERVAALEDRLVTLTDVVERLQETAAVQAGLLDRLLPRQQRATAKDSAEADVQPLDEGRR